MATQTGFSVSIEPIRHGAIIYDASRISHVSPALFDPSHPDSRAQPVGHGGRQAAWFVSGEFGSGVLRHYRRGGLVARVSSDRYVWHGPSATRSFAEFNVLAQMHTQGLPVPRPLAAMYVRSGLFYRAAILIERIADSRTLGELITTAPHSFRVPLEDVAAAIFSMHQAGFWHADLNAYNVLLDAGNRVWLIDFDKARTVALSSKNRHDNLARLRRSLLKIAPGAGDLWWKDINDAYSALLAPGNGPKV